MTSALVRTLCRALWLLPPLALLACSEAPAPVAEAPQPIAQGNRLHFPAGHPQLALLALSEARPGQAVDVDLPARLVWNEDKTQRLYPAFTGRVLAIRADVGQAVQAGQPLADLASPDFGQAQADTARAQADLRQAQKALQRQRELLDLGIAAAKDLDQAQADAERAQAEASRAVARTALYGSAATVNQRLALTAAVPGVVVERNLNPGQELRPDQSGPGVPPLFVVTDPRSLWVQIDAREDEVATLRPGASFQLMLAGLPNAHITGKITAVADFVDPATRTIKVRGVVDNSERLLKADMLASARFERSLGAGVVVPSGAVLLDGGHHQVFVQVAPGVFEPRTVSLGYRGPREVLVTLGLEVGEKVVSGNTLLLARQMGLAQDQAGHLPAEASAK